MTLKLQVINVVVSHFETSFVFASNENHVSPAIIITYFGYLDSVKEDFIHVLHDSLTQLEFFFHRCKT